MTGLGPRSQLHRLLQAGEFVVTAELQTSDSADPARIAGLAATLRGKVDAVNCTDNSAAHAHIAAIAAARLLLDQGVEPVMQLVCRDRNRLALQADLLGAAALGVRNVVCMTGDDVSAGDHPETKPIYDLDSVQLIRTARIMRDEGTYLSGRPLTDAPSFLIGAVENPFAPPLEFRPMRLGTKIEAGAEFIQTQICFNVDKLRLFMSRCGELGLLDDVWVLAGVFVPNSAAGARYLRDQVPGLDVPEHVIERMASVPPEAQKNEGIRMALEIVEAVREIRGISGIHLMTINHEEAIPRVVDGAGLLPRPPTEDVAIA
ncbi:MAG TPA: methylenetetrahydrofolate reductase [Actinomycetota bacterium]|nr:methylenetetrahydrofolate reductase [Actinomycetota bacterium]